MIARTDSAVQDHARRLLPINRGNWVIDRARRSLRDRTARLGSQEISGLDPEVLWSSSTDRGRGRHAHGFTFFADWSGAGPMLEAEEARALADLVHSTVLAWDERYGADRESAPEMAYHDETTAQRLLALIGALDLISFEEHQREDLQGLADRTAGLLADPSFHSGLNNHGMFQDLALLTWSVLLSPADDTAGDSAWTLAVRRLDEYFSSCFTAEGVHSENTPTYHVMVSRYLPVMAGIHRHAGSSSEGLYRTLLEGAERYAVHCIAPDGHHPPVSDTQRRTLDTDSNIATFGRGEFEYAATCGARGERPVDRTVAFPASGYAMTRSGWGDADASYVYFTCAYNDDYHKHSDELSVFLASGGRDLLCEAGAFGYNRRDPLTAYGYSSAAHNTLLVDGRGLPRTETSDRRHGELAPINQLCIDLATDADLDATGTTRRYPGREWSRRLQVHHGEIPSETTLTVTDRVRSTDGPAHLRFLWHLGSELHVLQRARGAEVFDGGTKVMELEVRTSADVRIGLEKGSPAPSPQGWYFPAFGQSVPAPVITVDCWQEDVDIVTEVRLSSFRWGTEERAALAPLIASGPSLPALSPKLVPSSGDRAVILLSPYDEASDHRRLTVELEKEGIPCWYVPGAHRDAVDAPTPDAAARTLQDAASSIASLARTLSAQGVELVIGTVGAAFAPGFLAALASGTPLLTLDPALPGEADGPRADRMAVALQEAVRSGPDLGWRVLVSSGRESAADRVMAATSPREPLRHDLRSILGADAEDLFSEQLRNALAATAGSEVRCIAGYDRRSRRFVVDLPEIPEDSSVSLRVFHGKKEVASSPYTTGRTHELEYSGSGPHRVRVHVRDPAGTELTPFTTGVIRVR